jgi:hypothetical protein
MSLIYVDNQNGNDSWDGDILTPKKSLSAAYTSSQPGGFIVLQTGDGSSYGNLSISKSISIIGAYGATPKVGALSISNAQCHFENLTFDTLSNGITVNNPLGAFSLENCIFDQVTYPVELTGVNYVSIHRNTFIGHRIGVNVDQAEEVNISSNVFDSGFRSIQVTTVTRMDIWRNTIYGAGDLSLGISPDENLRIIYHTVSAFDISNKSIQLPGFASTNSFGYDVVVNVVNGPSFDYGADYLVNDSGSLIYWDGLTLEDDLKAGDILRIMYAEAADPGGGDAIRALNVGDPNSRVDSNSITKAGSDILFGVFFNTPLKIRYNNFYGVTGAQPYTTFVAPTDDTGNFNDDPDYVIPGTDFHLQASSPNIDSGDPIRWDNILSEMGIGVINGSYTSIAGITGPSRVNVAAFNRDLDRDEAHRVYEDATGDVGAYEYLRGTFTGDDYYVDESGYDRANVGTQSEPLASIDRGAALAGPTNSVIVHTRVATPSYSNGYEYGRYRSKRLVFGSSNSAFQMGTGRARDINYVYPSYPEYSTGEVYVSPMGSDSEGDGSSSSPYRSINKALAAPGKNYVIVNPGHYSTFNGVTGKSLVGVPKTSTVNLSGDNYSKLQQKSWSTDPSLSGSADFSTNILTLNSEVSLLSDFDIESVIELKGIININTDEFRVRIVNNPGSVSKNIVFSDTQEFVEIRKYGTLTPKIAVRYGDSSNSYSISYDFIDQGEDVRISIILDRTSGAKFRIKGIKKIDESTNPENVDIVKDITKTFTNATGWKIAFYANGGSSAVVRDMNLSATDISGVDTYSSTKMKRKVFAILGA